MVRLQRRGQGRLHRPGHRRCADQRDLGLLLPPHRRDDVHDADRYAGALSGGAEDRRCLADRVRDPDLLSRPSADARPRLGGGVDFHDFLTAAAYHVAMRCLPLAWLLIASLAAPKADAGQPGSRGFGAPAPPTLSVSAGRLDALERWIKITAAHRPGDDDDPLQEIASWSNASLKDLWLDANVLVQIIRAQTLGMSGKMDRFTVRGEGRRPVQINYSKSQLRRLTLLACAASGMLTEPSCMVMNAETEIDPELRHVAALARADRLRGDANYVLRRGAILHSDVAMLAPLTMNAPGEVRSAAGFERLRMGISDGQEVDLHASAGHWEVARMLLDGVAPPGADRAAPGKDAMVRQWYRATAAWMQLREDHDKMHLDRARALFPPDADILFLSGCQRETYGGAAIQTAVRSAVLPPGVTLDVLSERDEWREAEAFFHRALEIRPNFGEARLRRGRVLGALGRHAEAVAELRRALGDLADPQLLYYAELFLGAAEEALGNRDAARVAYEQAAAHFPRAQSPLLALSQLARRYGDRGGALRAIERLFALSADERDPHDDPWWWYYVAQAADADDLIAAMHQPFLAERRP